MKIDLLNLLLVLLLAWLSGGLSKRLGYPSILGELAAGIVFGPALLGIIHGSPNLDVLAEIGVFLLMLYIGMEVDYRDLVRTSRAALLASLGGFVVPFVLGYLVTRHYGFPLQGALFLGLAMAVTALVTNPRILMELNLLGTRVAAVLLTGALICDTLALVAFAVVLGLGTQDGLRLSAYFLIAVKAVLFFGVTISVGLRVFPLIGSALRRFGFEERTTNFTMVVLIGLVFSALAHLAGLHAILGAFLAGMFIRGGILRHRLSHQVSRLVHDLSVGFLAPVFFVSAGFLVDLSILRTDLAFLLLVLVVAVASKVLGTAVFYLFSGHGWREGLVIGAGMNARGAVEIIVAQIGLSAGVITQDIYSILIFMAFFTTATAPLFLKWGADWLRRVNQLALTAAGRRGIIIAGATPLARLLAREFAGVEPVCLIDSNRDHCRVAESEGLRVVHGNALDEDSLEGLDAARARVVVAMTDNAEVNGALLQKAHDAFGVPEVFATVAGAHGPSAVRALFPTTIASEPWSSLIARRRVERVTYTCREAMDLPAIAERLQAERILPLACKRGREIAFLPGRPSVEAGDEIIGLRPLDAPRRDADLFDDLVQRAAILDLPGPMHMSELFRLVAGVLAHRLQCDAEEIRQSLVQREEESSTLLVPGIAIPHIVVDSVADPELLIARCREGVTFGEANGEARLVFVIIVTSRNRKLHLPALSAIARLFQDATIEESALAVEDVEGMRDLILATWRRRI